VLRLSLSLFPEPLKPPLNLDPTLFYFTALAHTLYTRTPTAPRQCGSQVLLLGQCRRIVQGVRFNFFHGLFLHLYGPLDSSRSASLRDTTKSPRRQLAHCSSHPHQLHLPSSPISQYFTSLILFGTKLSSIRSLFFSPPYLSFHPLTILPINFTFLPPCSPLSVTRKHIGAGVSPSSISSYAPQACGFCVISAHIFDIRLCRRSLSDIIH
jgi:hypothetical protein